MKISNIQVAFLEEAKQGAGYPKTVGTAPKTPKAINKLGSAKIGSGHDCFLKGIRVMMDITATQYEWMQLERYTFLDIVSSQSKMHKLMEMDDKSYFHKGVTPETFNAFFFAKSLYKRGLMSLDDLMANVPMGLLLTARMNTNYLQLKTIYNQRKNHRLDGWCAFIEFCEELPEFIELTGE